MIPSVRKYDSVDPQFVHLNHGTADLNLELSSDCLSTNLSGDPAVRGLLASATGSHFIPLPNDAKVAFSVKIMEVGKRQVENSNPVEEEGEQLNEVDDFDLRIGWAINPRGNLCVLGEQGSNSFAYCNSGKKCANSEHESFFHAFTSDDTITCMASFEEDRLEIRFARNRQDAEECAYSLPAESIGIKPGEDNVKLYPQVMVRQCAFRMNFGLETQEYLPDGYRWINDCPLKDADSLCTNKKEDYEVIMMVGLPGAGKTYETEKLIDQYPEKNYYTINFEHILSRLKLSSSPHCSGSESPSAGDSVKTAMEQGVRCFNRLLELAPSRPRNYIIDRCNVRRDVQRRVIGPFKGFQTRAVVVIPDDCTYQQQLETRDCNRNSLMDMKASMSLPRSEDVQEIVFVKLNEEGAREQVERYNNEGYAARRRSERSPRGDRYGGRRSPWSRKGDYRSESGQRMGDRYGGTRRDSSGSRADGYRFQPRRSSPYGQSSGGSYDYDRYYGSQRFGGGSVGGGYYNSRQRRSISPSGRQASGHQGKQWGYGRDPQSDFSFRPRHQYGDGFRMRGMPRPPYGMDYGGRMPRMPYGSSSMMRHQWDSRDMSRGPLLSGMGGMMPRQQHRMDNWHFSGRRSDRQTDWSRSAEWRGPRPLGGGSGPQQWAPRQDSMSEEVPNAGEHSPRQAGAKRRGDGSQKWPPSPERPPRTSGQEWPKDDAASRADAPWGTRWQPEMQQWAAYRPTYPQIRMDPVRQAYANRMCPPPQINRPFDWNRMRFPIGHQAAQQAYPMRAAFGGAEQTLQMPPGWTAQQYAAAAQPAAAYAAPQPVQGIMPAQYAAWAAAVKAAQGSTTAPLPSQPVPPQTVVSSAPETFATPDAAYMYAAQQQAAYSQRMARPAATPQVAQPVTQTTLTAAQQYSAATSQGAASAKAGATTASTAIGQMIDEPTAYAGYLSAGYDQATAKAMATAYVQQQQQYYQWHQQWAAAQQAAIAAAGTTAGASAPVPAGTSLPPSSKSS